MTRKTGRLVPNLGPWGFSLSVKMEELDNNCIHFESLFFQIQAAILKQENKLDVLGGLLEKCRPYFGRDFRAFSELSKEDLQDEMKLASHLAKYFTGDKDRLGLERILEIYQVKKNLEKRYDLLSLLQKTGALLKLKDEAKEEIFFGSKDLLSRMAPLPLALNTRLMEMVIAYKGQNRFWAMGAMARILNKNHMEYLFDIPGNVSHDPDKREKIQEEMFKIFSFIEEQLGDEESFRLFLTFWGKVFEGDFQEELLKEYDWGWSLNEIRIYKDSPTYGTNYPNLWLPLLQSRATLTESVDFLKSALTLEKFSRWGHDVLGLLPHYLPTDTGMAEIIKSEVEKLKISNRFYEKYLLTVLQENRAVMAYLGLPEIPKKQLDFLKRSFYRGLLQSGFATDFAVYQLIRLGDRGQDLLWWIAL